MNPHLIVSLLLAVLLVLVGCGESGDRDATDADGDGKPVVFATNYPLAYFAERIAGDTAEVRFPQIEGDPAFWRPSDAQIAEMQGAALILTNGAAYEKWAATASLPSAKTVDSSAAFADRYIVIADAKTHSHGASGDHSHGGTAFTTWLDFDQARQQAQAVRDALMEAMPNERDALKANADTLLGEISKLDQEMSSVTAELGERPLMASHPVYQYFARRYGLNIKAVLWEPETVPTASDMEGLETIRKDHPAKWMIWEGEPASESIALLGEIGVASVVVDPCGNRPDTGDWLSVMRQNVENLKALADNDG
ncbi:MAG: metal ABC transporter substrate-binding protein [Phycisphaeraceae bacterium]